VKLLNEIKKQISESMTNKPMILVVFS